MRISIKRKNGGDTYLRDGNYLLVRRHIYTAVVKGEQNTMLFEYVILRDMQPHLPNPTLYVMNAANLLPMSPFQVGALFSHI